MRTPLRSAPAKLGAREIAAPTAVEDAAQRDGWQLSSVNSQPVIVAPVKSAPLRLAPEKSQPVRRALRNETPLRFAREKSTPLSTLPESSRRQVRAAEIDAGVVARRAGRVPTSSRRASRSRRTTFRCCSVRAMRRRSCVQAIREGAVDRRIDGARHLRAFGDAPLAMSMPLLIAAAVLPALAPWAAAAAILLGASIRAVVAPRDGLPIAGIALLAARR